MDQGCLDEITEAATSIKLMGRAMVEMDLDEVEKGTCGLIIVQAVGVILKMVERLEEQIKD